MRARRLLGEAVPKVPACEPQLLSAFSCSQTPGQLCFTFLVCHPVLGLHSPWSPVPCQGQGPGRLRPGHRYLSETVLQTLEWGASHWASCENAIFPILHRAWSPQTPETVPVSWQLGPWEEAPVTAAQGTQTENWPQARISPGCGQPCSGWASLSQLPTWKRGPRAVVRKTGRRHAVSGPSSTRGRGAITQPRP